MIAEKFKKKYLFLSFLSGILEFGVIIFAIFANLSMLEVIFIGVGYQLGNFFISIYLPQKKFVLILLLLALLSYFLFLFTEDFYSLFFGVFLTSFSLQYLRKITRIKVSTIKKRSYRAVGFLLSSVLIFKYSILFVILAIFMIVLFESNKKDLLINKFKRIDKNVVSWLMVLHQIHYFSYVYFIPVILYKKNLISVHLIGILLTASWLVYMLIEKILKNKNYFKYAILGHSFLVLLIPLFIWNVENDLIFIIIWILTGLGGGTVFAVKKILEDSNKQYNLELSENIGHLFGVLLSFILFYIYNSFATAFILSAVSAFGVVILLIIIKFKRSCYDY